MKNRTLLALLVGSILLGVGCAGPRNVETIQYHGDPSASSPRSSSPSTAPASGDETISPSHETEAETTPPSSTPPPAAADAPTEITPPPAAPETPTPPTDSDGDGVPDSSDHCPGTPAGTTVDSTGCVPPPPPPRPECAGSNFAFVSNHGGIDNIYANVGGSVTALTNNTSWAISYDHLETLADTPVISFDESTFAGIFVLVRAKFAVDPSHSHYPIDDTTAWTRSFILKSDRSKAAYLWQKPEHGVWRSEIRVVSDLTDLSHAQVIDLGTTRSPTFGKITWWENKLIYQADEYDSGSRRIENHFYVVDLSERVPTPQKLVHDYSVLLATDWDDQFGSDPAVSPDGSSLVYSEPRTDGGHTITSCRLQETAGLHGTTFPQCVAKFEIAVQGSNTEPSWSPNGQWIYFSADRPAHAGNKEIYRIHPNGSGEERLTDSPDDDTSPVVLPSPRSCPAHP